MIRLTVLRNMFNVRSCIFFCRFFKLIIVVLIIYVFIHVYLRTDKNIDAMNKDSETCRNWKRMDANITACTGNLPSWVERVSKGNFSLDPERNKKFANLMPVSKRNELVNLLRLFVIHCDLHDIPYMLAYGSLIGAVRHFGIIPWDHDIDVMVDQKYRPQLLNISSTMTDMGYIMDIHRELHFRLKRSTHRTLFLDIFIYYIDGNSIIPYRDGLKVNMDYLFPTKMQPFEEFVLPIPYNTTAVLDLWYTDWTSCHFLRDHRRFRAESACKELHSMFPFVFHDASSVNLQRSTLKLDGQTLISITYQHN